MTAPPAVRLLARLALVGALACLAPAASGDDAAPPPGPRLYRYRVAVPTRAEVARLTSGAWDVLEKRGPDYLLVQGEAEVEIQLREAGFVVTLDSEVDRSESEKIFTYFGGYRTVAEHEAHLSSVAASRPDLATLVDYGNSWKKVHGRPDGHDLLALCITKKQPGDCALTPAAPKPRFFLMGAIHARELSAAEVPWRFIDELIAQYDLDPDVTALLDHNEIWVAPITNPDGRAIVEQGGNNPYTQRKNGDDALGSCSNPPTGSSQYGVDLNRNAGFSWGTSGSSTSPCSLVFQGPSAASEPEEQALESLMTQLFPDQKGPNLSDPVADTATGTMVTLHSDATENLWPYGHDYVTAPNDAQLRALAFRMGFFNGYYTIQSVDLYPASGCTDDWAYANLGVSAFTIEIGPTGAGCGGFTPAYSCQDSVFWPQNKGALLYAAKSARRPYQTPLGPSAVSLAASPTHTTGAPVTITGAVDDGVYGTSGTGRPAVQSVTAAEVYVDTPPWAGGTAYAMSAQDGGFNSSRENVTATISIGGLSIGRHIAFVRGRNAGGSWGPVTAVFFWVDAATTGRLYTVTPCRIVDTRNATGPLGGPALTGGSQRTFALAGSCGVPADAAAAVANVTITQPTAAGDLRIFPAGLATPETTVINFQAGQTRANNAILGIAGTPAGSVTVQADVPGGAVHVILDVSAYFK